MGHDFLFSDWAMRFSLLRCDWLSGGNSSIQASDWTASSAAVTGQDFLFSNWLRFSVTVEQVLPDLSPRRSLSSNWLRLEEGAGLGDGDRCVFVCDRTVRSSDKTTNESEFSRFVFLLSGTESEPEFGLRGAGLTGVLCSDWRQVFEGGVRNSKPGSGSSSGDVSNSFLDLIEETGDKVLSG